MRTFLLVILLAIPTLGMGQNSFYTDRAVGTFPINSQGVLVPITYGQVRVCSFPAIGSPCINPANGFIFDLGGNPLTASGGNFGQVTTDVVGRFSFGCQPGVYQVQVAASASNVPQLNYPITCPFPGGSPPINLEVNNLIVDNTLNATTINSVIWAGGTKYPTIGAAYADCPSTGGKVEVPPNWVSSELSLTAKQYCVIHHNGPCAVSFGTNTITVPAGVAGFAIESDIPMGSAFGILTAGCEYTYTGTGPFIRAGDSSADTRGLRIKNIGINLNNASLGASAVDTVRVITGCELTNLHIIGPGGANTQQGIILDGTGNYTGCVIMEPIITGVLKGIQFTGVGVNAGNANKVFGGQIGSPATGPSIGIDFEAGSGGNTVIGTDVESHAIGYNFGGTSQGNSLTVRSEANTSGVTFGASTVGNKVELINSVDPYALAGTNNQMLNITARTSTGSMVFSQACSGTATSATTLALQWFGGACTSAATGAQARVSNAGTLSNMRVGCGTAGASASSGAFTLRVNGSGTALTCTVGAGTTCLDTSHTVQVAAGDRLQMIFTTQNTETLADCVATWEKQ